MDVNGFRYVMFMEPLVVKPAPLSVIAPDGGPDAGVTVSVGAAVEYVKFKVTYALLTVWTGTCEELAVPIPKNVTFPVVMVPLGGALSYTLM